MLVSLLSVVICHELGTCAKAEREIPVCMVLVNELDREIQIQGCIIGDNGEEDKRKLLVNQIMENGHTKLVITIPNAGDIGGEMPGYPTGR